MRNPDLTSAVRALLSVCYVLGLYFLFFWKKIVSGEFSDSPRVRIFTLSLLGPGSTDWGN